MSPLADDLGIPPDLRAATERIQQFSEEAQRRAVQFQEVAEQAERASVTEQSDDRSITVTVASSGALTDLQMTNRIREQDASRTAAEVVRLVQLAQSRIVDQVQSIVDNTVDDSELSQQVSQNVVDSFRQRFPSPVDESDESPGPGQDPDDEDWNERSIMIDPDDNPRK